MSKYNRVIAQVEFNSGGKQDIIVDVYDVLKAFNVTCPALQHLIKKALCTGLRGHKSTEQDLQDIVDSSISAQELNSGFQIYKESSIKQIKEEQTLEGMINEIEEHIYSDTKNQPYEPKNVYLNEGDRFEIMTPLFEPYKKGEIIQVKDIESNYVRVTNGSFPAMIGRQAFDSESPLLKKLP